jgi:hypothetical protein
MNVGLKARELRQKVMIPARMRAGDAYVDVCIRNISSRGLMLQTAAPPPPGTYVEILRAAHVIVGRIVWTRDRRFGVHAGQRIDIASIVNHVSPAGARPPNQDRRSADRTHLPQRKPDTAEQLERSRRFSRAFEFGVLTICAVTGAGMLASLAYKSMAQPFEVVANHLR